MKSRQTGRGKIVELYVEGVSVSSTCKPYENLPKQICTRIQRRSRHHFLELSSFRVSGRFPKQFRRLHSRLSVSSQNGLISIVHSSSSYSSSYCSELYASDLLENAFISISLFGSLADIDYYSIPYVSDQLCYTLLNRLLSQYDPKFCVGTS